MARSWSEPHWYAKGRSVDTDPVDWTKKIVTRHEVNVLQHPNLPGKPDKDAKPGPAFEASAKSDDELPDGATAAEAVERLSALKAKGEPFLLAVGFLEPHLPFVAPEEVLGPLPPKRSLFRRSIIFRRSSRVRRSHQRESHA